MPTRDKTYRYSVTFEQVYQWKPIVNEWAPVRWTSQAWKRPNGKPTNENLARFIHRTEASTRPGGANEHLGETMITKATIADERGVVAWYSKPLFSVNAPARRVAVRKNPSLLVLGNPPRRRENGANEARRRGVLLSERVVSIRYRHAQDGQWYGHTFAAGVCLELLPDGSVRLYQKNGKPLFKQF